MAEYDLIIKGGTVVDGTLAPRYRSDIAIKDGRIAQIGGLRGRGAPKVLDAAGLIVAPGFVDLHTHYDGQIQWDPYCTSSGWNGVTSVVIGNCGFGFAPCRPADQDRAMLCLTRNEAIPFEVLKLGMRWDWVTFPEFLNTLDRIPKGVNVLTYVPLTPIYTWVMGWEESKIRRPTEKELTDMGRLVREGMDAGACGWSAQVLGPNSVQRDYDGLPMVTDLIPDEELLAFARVLAEHGDGRSVITGRGKKVYEQVAEVSGRPAITGIGVDLQGSAAGSDDAKRQRATIGWLEECCRRGLQVYGVASTGRGDLGWTFEHWNLYDDSPVWRVVTMGTLGERKAKMQDPQMRARLRAEWDSGVRTGAQFHADLGEALVRRVKDQRFKSYEGLRGEAIAAREGKHVVDAVLDLVVADDLQTEFWAEPRTLRPEHVAKVVRSPYVAPGISDGGAHLKFTSNGGHFPTDLLMWLVRDLGLVSLEEAHYKLSYLSAFVGGFRDRGFLKEGAPADIVIYELEKLAVKPVAVAYDLPGNAWRRTRKADGYRWTIVNGQITLDDNKPTGALSGKFLRHGKG